MKYGILATFLIVAGCSMGNPGSGEKVGQIAKITNEGVFCTTMTVLVTGKFGGGELYVTVDNRLPELQAQVRHFQDTQEQVEVKYHSSLFMGPCSNETENVMMDSITAHPEGAAK
jgi:hypothetical protein